ncbi:hypothetical protein SCALIN_C27_0104 [Candidatus Scalindua japonica]|uniref:Uncharacterized protein n=1 Tax=Candidatus Scalindua japonica TaxID=1284222 RepID=A0A286U0N6_9BACT|nr:hypothetical protein SCALIN_C27_0104 [Candidatus Scalindua japonica]
MMVYVCIAFFVTTVVLVGITFRGNSQAGLIEVGSAALLFVIFLQILKIVIPESSGKIITILSILIAIMLIFANFSLQRGKHKEYTFKELLVGDLLVKKLIGEDKNIPEKLLAERLKHVMPGEFAKSKTENDTIESSFEMPERVLLGRPITLPINKRSSIATPVRKGEMHSFYIPEETENYKLEIADSEGLKIDRAGIATSRFVVQLNKSNGEVAMPNIPEPFQHPSEAEIDYSILNRIINSKPELPATISEPEISTALPEKHVDEDAGKQIEEKL